MTLKSCWESCWARCWSWPWRVSCREFGLFFILQFISYLNLVINFRAISTKQTSIAIVTDGLAGLIAWTMVRRIGHAKGHVGLVGVILGGMAATWLGIWLTQHWD
jgi:hypothetical protein